MYKDDRENLSYSNERQPSRVDELVRERKGFRVGE